MSNHQPHWEYVDCICFREVRPPPKKCCSLYDTKLHLVVMLHLYYLYLFQFYSDHVY